MTRRELEQFAYRMEPRVRDAYLEAVRQASRVSLAALTEAVAAADVERIMTLLNLDMDPVAEAIRDGYREMGRLMATSMPPLPTPAGGTLALTFSMANPRAEQWIRTMSSGLVTRIDAHQRDAIQTVLRHGLGLGQNPKATAEDIAGRIGATGRRQGGIVGLTGPQAAARDAAFDELRDPDRLGNYFTRKRREKAFDGLVQRAINEGRALSLTDARRVTAAYADNLLLLRGETIARTETIASLNAARREAVSQGLERAGLDRSRMQKTWLATLGPRTRDQHIAMHKQTVPFDEPFTAPNGDQLMQPGDSSLGAGAENIANCRCWTMYKFPWLKGLR